MDNPTFPERTAALKDAAAQLKACAETVLAEAQRMEAAEKRFAQRIGKRTTSLTTAQSRLARGTRPLRASITS
jgi:hypothetical protein